MKGQIFRPELNHEVIAGPVATFSQADIDAAAQTVPVTVVKPKKPTKQQRALHWAEACTVRADH
jgi:hypothetical protein